MCHNSKMIGLNNEAAGAKQFRENTTVIWAGANHQNKRVAELGWYSLNFSRILKQYLFLIYNSKYFYLLIIAL